MEPAASRGLHFARLSRLLFDLETVAGVEDVFRSVLLPSDPPLWQGAKRALFGGQVAAQSLTAAYRTVPDDRLCHSFHSYFIAPGDKTQPVEYRVKRVRDGRSYTSRMVEGVQDSRTIFTMIASFSLPESEVVHINHPMPKVQPVESLDVTGFLMAAAKNEQLADDLRANARAQLDMYSQLALEIQPVEPLVYYRVRPADEPRVHMWVRVRDAPAAGEAAALSPRQGHILTAYIADMGILRGGMVSDVKMRAAFVTSLDHSVYFHEPLAGPEFALFESQCVYGGRGRTSNKGHLWRRDGALVATIFQEGLVRLASQPASAI